VIEKYRYNTREDFTRILTGIVFKQVGDEGLQALVPFSKVIQETEALNVINFQE